MKSFWADEHKGVVHCFSGDDAELDAYLDLGLNIGITGIVTMQSRGSGLRRMVRRIPAERILVETDAPYLTPAQRTGLRAFGAAQVGRSPRGGAGGIGSSGVGQHLPLVWAA